MANGGDKKAKDKFVKKTTSAKTTGKKTTYKTTTSTKKVVPKTKAKVTLTKKAAPTKYNIVIKSKSGKTRSLPTRIATPAQAKKLAATKKKK